MEGKKKNLSLGRSSLPSLVGPRQGHLAPGALHPFPHLPRSLALWSLPSRTLASSHPLLRPLSSTFSRLPPFALFSFSSPFFFDFVAEFVDFSSFSIESIAGEFGEILLNFPSFPFECYFDFAFRFPSFLLVDLDRFTGFSLKEQIVSLNFLPRFFLDLDPRRIGAGCEFYLTFSLLLFLLSIFIFIFFLFPLSIPIESIAGESETLLNFFSTFFPLRIYFHFHFFLDFFSIESIARKFVRSNKPCLNFSIYFFEPILIFTFGDRIDSIG